MTNITSRVNKDIFTLDEEVSVNVLADHSEFKLTVSDIKVHLVRTIVLKLRDGTSKVFKTTVWKSTLGKIEKGTKDDDYRNLKIELMSVNDDHAPKDIPDFLPEFVGKIQQS